MRESGMQWETASTIPEHWRVAWNTLTRSQTPLADAEWVRSFSEAFGESMFKPTIHLLHRDGELVAAVPLVRRTGLAPAWTSFENEHHPYWEIAGQLDAATAEQLLGHLVADRYLFLRRIHMNSANCAAILDAAQRMGLQVSLIESEMGDARVAVRGTWDAFRKTLPREYRENLPRSRRQLERAGKLELVSITRPGPELDAALVACFALETRGWKGETGHPILTDRRTLAFYSDVARSLAANERFELFLLRHDDKVIAFEYCLRGGGHVELLKESYDPDYSSRGPSHLLRLMVLEELFRRGVPVSYHMGRATVAGDPREEWKLRWATEVAPLCTLRIYGKSLRARVAYAAGPVLRARLKQSPLVGKLRASIKRIRRRLTRR